jgi:4-amino-4-deoxy-L-arabinose transferase-like glycosyltransferase
VLLFVVLFWRLGVPTFWDPDEAHYAQTSRELIDTRDWLAPYYNQGPFFDKPILFHWARYGTARGRVVGAPAMAVAALGVTYAGLVLWLRDI